MNDTGEEAVVCPYDKAHLILKSRMQFHLTKCRANYPNAEKTICPFNSTHRVNVQELKNHEENCPDRGVVDNFVYRMSNNPAPVGLLPVQTFTVCSNDDESWDDPPENTPSVLQQVQEQVMTKGVLIPKIGAPKSERKNHRFNERLRHAQIKNESEAKSRQGAAAPAPAPGIPQAPQQKVQVQEQKKVDVAPPPHVPEPKLVHPQSSGSQSTAAPVTNPWSGGRPAPQVSSTHEFPTLGSKGSRRDNDNGLPDQMNNMTLLDSDRNERPNVWGKPAPRQQDARISVPAGGFGGGGNRPHSNPWGRSQQQPAKPVQDKAIAPEAQKLGPMPAITPDDFPVLNRGQGRGRRIRN